MNDESDDFAASSPARPYRETPPVFPFGGAIYYLGGPPGAEPLKARPWACLPSERAPCPPRVAAILNRIAEQQVPEAEGQIGREEERPGRMSGSR